MSYTAILAMLVLVLLAACSKEDAPPAASGGVASDSATSTSQPDRTACVEIQGTQFRSENERNWFALNCLAASTVPAPTPLAPTPLPLFAGCNPNSVPLELRTGNLIINPSMEDGSGPPGWRRIRFDGTELPLVIDKGVAHTGACSLKLERRTTGDCPTICGYWTAGTIPVDSSKVYSFTAWIRGSSSLIERAALVAAFRVLDAAGNEISRGGIGRTLSGGSIESDWQQLQIRIGPTPSQPLDRPWPPGAASLIIDMAWTGTPRQDGVEGDIWIDDVFFGLAP